MSSTGTRPPLFGPDPDGGGGAGGGFDGDPGAPRQQFPLRRTGSGGPGRPPPPPGSSSSPRWVRPFLIGGLLLVAVVLLLSVFGGDDPGPDQPAGDPDAGQDDPVAEDPVAEDPVADAAVGDDTAAEDPAVDVAAEADDDIPAADPDPSADPDAAEPTPEGSSDTPGADAPTQGAEGQGAEGQGAFSAADLQIASAFAVQFAHDYLNYDQAQPGVRERELGAYLAPDLDPQLGWDGQGTQLAVLTVPIETAADDDRVVVTIAAQVTGQDAPRWVHLAVPLARDDRSRWAVTAAPAYVPRPAAGTPTGAEPVEVDEALSGALTEPMTQLFQAYGAEAIVSVAGVTAAQADIRGLGGLVTFTQVDAVRITAGDDTAREGTVTVTWEDPVTGGSFRQDYEVSLAGAEGSWLVQEVRTG